LADREVEAFELLDPGRQPVGKVDATSGDAEQNDVLSTLGAFQKFVGHPRDGTAELGGLEDGSGDCRIAGGGSCPIRPLGSAHEASFPASRDGSLKEQSPSTLSGVPPLRRQAWRPENLDITVMTDCGRTAVWFSTVSGGRHCARSA
jgi:hypothetical protein